MKTGEIKNPSYSNTRTEIREYILEHVEEFKGELEKLERELVKSVVSKDKDGSKIIVSAQFEDEKKCLEFAKRWHVAITTDDNLKFYYRDLKNPKPMSMTLDLISEAKDLLADEEYILIPKRFTTRELREIAREFFVKPAPYENFGTWDLLNDAISFFKLVRYGKMKKDHAIKKIVPSYNYTEDSVIRENFLRRFDDIASIIDFPSDLKHVA